MSFTVKEIINEAYDRTGVFPNPTDALPGEFFDRGLKALKGLVNYYNIRNYITCTQRMATLKVPADGIVHLEKTDEDVTPKVYDVTNINKVYWQNTEGGNIELKYVSFMEFPGYSQGNYIYSWNQVGAYSYDVILQKWMVGKTVDICYNVPFECEVDTVYYLPPEYCELFTLGLCLKLLTIFPREDTKMYEQMGAELQTLTGAIEAKQSSAKILEWNRHDSYDRQAAFRSGSFLGV